MGIPAPWPDEVREDVRKLREQHARLLKEKREREAKTRGDAEAAQLRQAIMDLGETPCA